MRLLLAERHPFEPLVFVIVEEKTGLDENIAHRPLPVEELPRDGKILTGRGEEPLPRLGLDENAIVSRGIGGEIERFDENPPSAAKRHREAFLVD